MSRISMRRHFAPNWRRSSRMTMLPTDKRFHRNLFQNARSGHILTGYVRLYFNIWVIAHNITKRKNTGFPLIMSIVYFSSTLTLFFFCLPEQLLHNPTVIRSPLSCVERQRLRSFILRILLPSIESITSATRTPP